MSTDGPLLLAGAISADCACAANNTCASNEKCFGPSQVPAPPASPHTVRLPRRLLRACWVHARHALSRTCAPVCSTVQLDDLKMGMMFLAIGLTLLGCPIAICFLCASKFAAKGKAMG